MATVERPEGLAELLGATPQACAAVGDERGYLIAVLEDNAELQALRPPGRALAQLTSRALLVTCRTNGPSAGTDDSGVDVHYRYFAPQYGVSEDPATGSAMRLLAQFWQDKGLGDRLNARQCSPEGGLLRSEIEGTLIWVGGRVLRTEREQLDNE